MFTDTDQTSRDKTLKEGDDLALDCLLVALHDSLCTFLVTLNVMIKTIVLKIVPNIELSMTDTYNRLLV